MALKDIESLVLGKAQKEAEDIRSTAESKTNERRKKAEQDLKVEHERDLAECKERLQREFQTLVANVRADHGRQLLEQKNRFLEDILEKARQTILSRPQGKYPAWLSALVRRAAQVPDAIICVNPKDHALVADEVSKNELAVQLAEPQESVDAGIRVRGKQFDLDLTAEARLNEVWQQLRSEAAKELFG